VPHVTHLEVMEWGLHTRPENLLQTMVERIRLLEDRVEAVMLGYGRCQAMDRLPGDLKIPVFYPQAEDCIGVLLGQDRYAAELQKEAGTWFFTPGWTRMGMEFIFKELQLGRFAEKGIDPLQVAHRMLQDYTRGLFIDMKIGHQVELRTKAQAVANEFQLRLEHTTGSYKLLRSALKQALACLDHRDKPRL
jgi:hypothetical protein